MLAFIIVLYVLSAALPIGLIVVRIPGLVETSRRLKDVMPDGEATLSAFGQASTPLVLLVQRGARTAFVDLICVGGGVVLGAAASILSLTAL